MSSFTVKDESGSTFQVDESKIADAEKDGFLPVVTNGKDEHRVAFSDLSLAMKDGYSPVGMDLGVSKTESALRGVAQGASLGYADELTGAGEAGLDVLTGKSDLSDVGSAYSKHRDESRQAYDAAQKANPLTYGAGQVGGGLATALVPGLGEMNLLKLGALGAVQAVGDSKADNVGDLAKDAAIGGVTGAAAGKALEVASPYIGKALGGVGNFTDGALAKIGKIGASVDEGVTQRYLANPDAVKNALPKDDVATWIMGEDGPLSQLKNHVSDLDSHAWSLLSNEPSMDKKDVLNVGQDLVNNVLGGKNNSIMRTGGVGASAEKLRAINSKLEEISSAYGDQLSESDLKSIIQDLQKQAFGYEGNPKYTAQAEGIRQLGGIYNDALKKMNPLYGQAMEPVAEATDKLNQLQKIFVNKQDPDGLDKTLNAIKGWNSKSDVSNMKQSVGFLDQKLGTGLGDMMQATHDSGQFLKTDTNGYRKTVLGSVLGGGAGFAVGGPLGATVGSGAGALVAHSLDKNAGVVFQKMLDGRLAAGDALSQVGQRLGPYAKVLADAAQRGPQAVTATHFLLSQRDPKYRDMVKKLEDNSGDNEQGK
jgi:hypothetical protein